jgi:nicotinate-nucleotide pyrophosphorylase (carboxylating)
MKVPPDYSQDLEQHVRLALAEDIGGGDITAALIAESTMAEATVITREHMVMAGQQWVDEVFRQLDGGVQLEWHYNDGEQVSPNQVLLTARGRARSLLTGERTALNFLQLLSGTATVCREYADVVAGTGVKLLDTRKTIPGLRKAQKYAVTCGGCHNHRMGLYDAFLVKENHIAACGGIAPAIARARQVAPGKPVEVEVESMEELDQALTGGADIIMLDNFSVADTARAVLHVRARAKLESSGGITRSKLRAFAETGVDYISIGSLTKDVRAIDLSMRVTAVGA